MYHLNFTIYWKFSKSWLVKISSVKRRLWKCVILVIPIYRNPDLKKSISRFNSIPDVSPAPSDLRLSNITATSAVIAWLPSNSNYNHVVIVNRQESRLATVGIYRFLLTGRSHNVPLARDDISKGMMTSCGDNTVFHISSTLLLYSNILSRYVQ